MSDLPTEQIKYYFQRIWQLWLEVPDKGWVVVFLGLMFILLSFNKMQIPYNRVEEKQKYAHKHYKPVEASILVARVKTVEHEKYMNQSHEEPEILYQYKVGDEIYVGDRYWYTGKAGVKTDPAALAHQLKEQYDGGDVVTAYYDPEDPDIAVLNNNSPGLKMSFRLKYLYTIIIGVFMMILGLAKVWTLRDNDTKAPANKDPSA